MRVTEFTVKFVLREPDDSQTDWTEMADEIEGAIKETVDGITSRNEDPAFPAPRAQRMTTTFHEWREGDRYVNAYEVSRAYGGPEEGGWWYDVGDPLKSIPVESDEEAEKAKEDLRAEFGPVYDGRRTRFSVIGEENLVICEEEHPAEAYPAEIPHYE